MELVTQPIGAAIVTPEGPMPLTVTFSYFDHDPVAVHMTLVLAMELPSGVIMHDGSTWTFARDLLDGALASRGQVGEGSVKITYLDRGTPRQDQIRFDLIDAEGLAHPIFLPARPVVNFMTEALRMTPPAAVGVDVDDAIAQILGQA